MPEDQLPFPNMPALTEDASLVRWVNSLSSYGDPIRRLAGYYSDLAVHARENTAVSERVVEHLERAVTQIRGIASIADEWKEHTIKTVMDAWMRTEAPRRGIHQEMSADNVAARQDREQRP